VSAPCEYPGVAIDGKQAGADQGRTFHPFATADDLLTAWDVDSDGS
jgi:hypothetical protein